MGKIRFMNSRWMKGVSTSCLKTLRMFEILDYKWKVDPETGEERWLEVIRAVVDGSVDKRKEDAYAETPDRTVLLVSFEATTTKLLSIASAFKYALTASPVILFSPKWLQNSSALGEQFCPVSQHTHPLFICYHPSDPVLRLSLLSSLDLSGSKINTLSSKSVRLGS
jgi:hypothetical protein